MSPGKSGGRPPRKRLRCLLELFLGWLLVVAGLLVTPLPVPVGILLLLLGLVLLIRCSDSVRQRVRWLRSRYPGFSGRLQALEPKVNASIARSLRETDPSRESGS